MALKSGSWAVCCLCFANEEDDAVIYGLTEMTGVGVVPSDSGFQHPFQWILLLVYQGCCHGGFSL